MNQVALNKVRLRTNEIDLDAEEVRMLRLGIEAASKRPTPARRQRHSATTSAGTWFDLEITANGTRVVERPSGRIVRA